MEASCVLIPCQLSKESPGIFNQDSNNHVQNVYDWELALAIAIERNIRIFDNLILINRLRNFKQINNVFMKFGVENFKQIIRSCPLDIVSDIAFAAFESDPEEILIVTGANDLSFNDKEYFVAIEQAKELAALGNIVKVDFEPVILTKNASKQISEVDQSIYSFKPAVYLDELLRYDPVVYQTVKRAHFKKSNSFVNELLDQMIPKNSIDETILWKSNFVKNIKIKLTNNSD